MSDKPHNPTTSLKSHQLYDLVKVSSTPVSTTPSDTLPSITYQEGEQMPPMIDNGLLCVPDFNASKVYA